MCGLLDDFSTSSGRVIGLLAGGGDQGDGRLPAVRRSGGAVSTVHCAWCPGLLLDRGAVVKCRFPGISPEAELPAGNGCKMAVSGGPGCYSLGAAGGMAVGPHYDTIAAVE